MDRQRIELAGAGAIRRADRQPRRVVGYIVGHLAAARVPECERLAGGVEALGDGDGQQGRVAGQRGRIDGGRGALRKDQVVGSGRGEREGQGGADAGEGRRVSVEGDPAGRRRAVHCHRGSRLRDQPSLVGIGIRSRMLHAGVDRNGGRGGQQQDAVVASPRHVAPEVHRTRVVRRLCIAAPGHLAADVPSAGSGARSAVGPEQGNQPGASGRNTGALRPAVAPRGDRPAADLVAEAHGHEGPALGRGDRASQVPAELVGVGIVVVTASGVLGDLLGHEHGPLVGGSPRAGRRDVRDDEGGLGGAVGRGGDGPAPAAERRPWVFGAVRGEVVEAVAVPGNEGVEEQIEPHGSAGTRRVAHQEQVPEADRLADPRGQARVGVGRFRIADHVEETGGPVRATIVREYAEDPAPLVRGGGDAPLLAAAELAGPVDQQDVVSLGLLLERVAEVHEVGDAGAAEDEIAVVGMAVPGDVLTRLQREIGRIVGPRRAPCEQAVVVEAVPAGQGVGGFRRHGRVPPQVRPHGLVLLPVDAVVGLCGQPLGVRAAQAGGEERLEVAGRCVVVGVGVAEHGHAAVVVAPAGLDGVQREEGGIREPRDGPVEVPFRLAAPAAPELHPALETDQPVRVVGVPLGVRPVPEQEAADIGVSLVEAGLPRLLLRLVHLAPQGVVDGGDPCVVDPGVIVVIPPDVLVEGLRVVGQVEDVLKGAVGVRDQALPDLAALRGREVVVVPVVGHGQGEQEVPHHEVVRSPDGLLVPRVVAQHGEEEIREFRVVGLGGIDQLDEGEHQEPIVVPAHVHGGVDRLRRVLEMRLHEVAQPDHVPPLVRVRGVAARAEIGQVGLVKQQVRVGGAGDVDRLGDVQGPRADDQAPRSGRVRGGECVAGLGDPAPPEVHIHQVHGDLAVVGPDPAGRHEAGAGRRGHFDREGVPGEEVLAGGRLGDVESAAFRGAHAAAGHHALEEGDDAVLAAEDPEVPERIVGLGVVRIGVVHGAAGSVGPEEARREEEPTHGARVGGVVGDHPAHPEVPVVRDRLIPAVVGYHAVEAAGAGHQPQVAPVPVAAAQREILGPWRSVHHELAPRLSADQPVRFLGEMAARLGEGTELE